MGWREYANQVREARHIRHDRHDRAVADPIVPVAPNEPKPLPPDPTRALKAWREGLSGLAYSRPPSCLTTLRWGQLLDDAEFIFNGFGEQLARQGWSAHDVFGVLPWRENGGALLDRLQGARNLKLDGEGRAFWSHPGITLQTCRGAGDALVSSGLVLVWEMDQRHEGRSSHD